MRENSHARFCGGVKTYPNLLGTGYRVTKESTRYPGYGIAEILNFKVGYNHDTKFPLYTTISARSALQQGKVSNSTDPGSLVQPLQELFFWSKSTVGNTFFCAQRKENTPRSQERSLYFSPQGGLHKLQTEPIGRELLRARKSVYPPIRAFCIKPTLICLYGIDKNQVTQVAAQIRKIRPPSAYTGKGIFVVDPSDL